MLPENLGAGALARGGREMEQVGGGEGVDNLPSESEGNADMGQHRLGEHVLDGSDSHG